MKKLFVILLLAGCNEPIKHEATNYTGNSEWIKLHQLVTEIESKEVERCILTSQPVRMPLKTRKTWCDR